MVLLSYHLLTVYLTIKRSDYDGSTIRGRGSMIHHIFFCLDHTEIVVKWTTDISDILIKTHIHLLI